VADASGEDLRGRVRGRPPGGLVRDRAETCDEIIDLYRRVWDFADATLEELPLDVLGRVPWWREERNPVTLQRITLHVIVDLARDVGHADILREEIDGAAGLRAGVSNLPEQQDWPAYVAKLTLLAEQR
jgi:hypothetical protein